MKALVFCITSIFFTGCFNRPEPVLEDYQVEELKELATGNRVFFGDPEPRWPGKKNDDTLLGIDSDNDGVRDDIEIWINDRIKDHNLNKAIKQYAKYYRLELKLHDAPLEEFLENHTKVQFVMACVSFCNKHVFGTYQYYRTIRAMTHNTRERLMVKDAINEKLVHSSNQEHLKLWDEWKACEFEVQNKEYLIDYIKKM